MLRAVAVRPLSTWTGVPADRIALPGDERYRRRMALRAKGGIDFLLDLPAATMLHSGDALVLEDGRLIEVVALPEPLLEICCTDAAHLARLAWHLGNRHVEIQIIGDKLRLRRDHVLEAMLRGLGATLAFVEAPFEPEAGAYLHNHGEFHV